MSKTRPKIEPTVLRYESMAELPPVDELVRLAESHEWLQVEIAVREPVTEGKRHYDPERDTRKRLSQELTKRLPDHTIWGGEGVRYETLSQTPVYQHGAGYVIQGTATLNLQHTTVRQIVAEHLDTFLAAALRYEELVNPVMERLAKQFGLDLAVFSSSRSWPDYLKYKASGLIAARPGEPETDTWGYFFHGGDCGLSNAVLGGWGRGRLEARLGFGAECGNNFGVLDPSFFSEFISGNASFASLAEKQLNWQKMQHALQIMESMRLFRLVHSERRGSEGWVLTDAGRQRANEAQAESETADA